MAKLQDIDTKRLKRYTKQYRLSNIYDLNKSFTASQLAVLRCTILARMDIRSEIFYLAFRVLRVAILVYLGLLALLAGCQRRFIYYPSRMSRGEALQSARRAGVEPFRDAGGRFCGWRRSTNADGGSGGRVLVFHGNAGHAMQRIYYAEGFDAAGTAPWDIFLFEYPGYGSRPGRPSEEKIMEAGASALAALIREDPSPVYLVGESLGSGPACGLAADYPEDVAGLWLITPFTDLADVARIHYPFFPVRLLLRDNYDNMKALRSYRGPVAVLTAEHDSVVPARLGRRLYESAVTSRKWFREQPGVDHNTLDLSFHAGIWSDIIAFWNSAGEENKHERDK